jgi:phage/conjugal plasmid C-4 type zinc finger TraR family protein
MDINEQPEYNNEEEAEVAQILDITRNLAAVARVQEALALQRSQPSLEECEDCGEDIPDERRKIALGCTRCIHCQALYERKKAGY